MDDTFFESEVVTRSIEEIMDMQNQVLLFATFGEYASIEDQRENLNLLRRLQEKQKNMCFRCVLSQSANAKQLLEDVMNHFREFGHTVDPENPMKVFDEVEVELNNMEKDLDFCEKYGYFPGEEPGGETPPDLPLL